MHTKILGSYVYRSGAIFHSKADQGPAMPLALSSGHPILKVVNTFLVDGKTINSKHKVVTIGFFFTDNMFRSLTLQVRRQG